MRKVAPNAELIYSVSLQGAHLSALEAAWREREREPSPKAGGDVDPRPAVTGRSSGGSFGGDTAVQTLTAAVRGSRSGGLEPIAEEVADGPAQTNGTPALATRAVASLVTSHDQQHDELDQQDTKRRKVSGRASQPVTHHEGF